MTFLQSTAFNKAWIGFERVKQSNKTQKANEEAKHLRHHCRQRENSPALWNDLFGLLPTERNRSESFPGNGLLVALTALPISRLESDSAPLPTPLLPPPRSIANCFRRSDLGYARRGCCAAAAL